MMSLNMKVDSPVDKDGKVLFITNGLTEREGCLQKHHAIVQLYVLYTRVVSKVRGHL